MLTLAVFLPIVCGLLMLVTGFGSRRVREIAVEGVTIVTSLIVLLCLTLFSGETNTPMYLMNGLPITFRLDGVGSVFAALVAFLWPLAALYGFEYMEHEGGENHFFALYTITYGVTLGIASAANILTLYVFYEFLTLCTMPLVMHGTSKASVRAGKVYMMYSFVGAALAFVGVMMILGFGDTAAFTLGGVISADAFAAHPLAIKIGYLCAFLGFGVKAAVFPMHAWLPTVSVAPTPVTALLHAVAVVKSGAFGIIRMTYFCFGAGLLLGGRVQNAVILLASATIVYGSAMAVREHHFKRRLAYSTVSNLSYIVLAAVMMSSEGLTAALTHMIFHGMIKITLFFVAGAVLVKTGRTQVEQLRGLHRVMPFTCAVYTLAALALMGTPLLPGFVSKWMIGSAAVASSNPIALVGLAAILISAVLTAIYLMGPALSMYLRPFEETENLKIGQNADPGMRMRVPFIILSAAIVLCGLFSAPIVSWLTAAAATVL